MSHPAMRLASGRPSYAGLSGREEVLDQQVPSRPIGSGDLVHDRWMRGGGFGDPLRRNMAAVLADRPYNTLSLSRTADVYGVIIDVADATVDEEARPPLLSEGRCCRTEGSGR